MNITSTKTPLRTLIVSAPGIMGDSLRALLASFPQIDIVGIAPGCLTAHNLAQDLSPDLVIIDANHPESEIVSLLQSLHANQCAPLSMIFTNTPSQRKRLKKAGADRVLLRTDASKPLAEILMQLQTVKQAEA